jgi:hypothetical protein
MKKVPFFLAVALAFHLSLSTSVFAQDKGTTIEATPGEETVDYEGEPLTSDSKTGEVGTADRPIGKAPNPDTKGVSSSKPKAGSSAKPAVKAQPKATKSPLPLKKKKK